MSWDVRISLAKELGNPTFYCLFERFTVPWKHIRFDQTFQSICNLQSSSSHTIHYFFLSRIAISICKVIVYPRAPSSTLICLCKMHMQKYSLSILCLKLILFKSVYFFRQITWLVYNLVLWRCGLTNFIWNCNYKSCSTLGEKNNCVLSLISLLSLTSIAQ